MDEYPGPIKPVVFFGIIFIDVQQFPFLATPNQCLGKNKIIGKWLYLNKYDELPQYFLPSCIIWILLSHKSIDWFFAENIGWDVLIYISQNSDSFSWWSRSIREMALAPYKWRIATTFSSHILECIYRCPIEPLIFIWVNIGLATPIFISCDSDTVSWWTHKKENGSSSIHMKNFHNILL